MAADQILLSCEDLKAQVDSGNVKDLIIIDVSWSSQENCYELYKQEHIPGAVYLNVMDGPSTDLLPRNIPSTEAMQAKAKAAGIGQASHLVLYSSGDLAGFLIAGRAWWTFRIYGLVNVSILNGGLARWKALGFPLSTDIPYVKEGDFIPTWNETLYTNFEQAEKIVQNKSMQICDSRSPDVFANPGHIIGARNLFLKKLIDPEKQVMKPLEEIKKEFEDAGIDLSRPLLVYCGLGMSSATLLFAAVLCGAINVSLYHGSFTEWKVRASPELIKKIS